MHSNNENSEDIKKIQREIILLKKQIAHLKFKNSPAFKILSTINLFIFIIYLQFILSYLFHFNSISIPNHLILFNIEQHLSEKIRIYTLKFKYKNYIFKVQINKDIDKNVLNSNAIISSDLIFHIPQKLQLTQYTSQWFFVYESLGMFTICAIILFVQIIVLIYKQNEEYYPLLTISSLSILSFIGISSFAIYIHNFH